MLRRIGAEEGGEFKAVASGTVSSGKPVIVNSDGTVSLPVSVTGGNGTPNTFSGGDNATHNGMSEVGNSKFVIAYRDGGNSNYGTAVVATGSGTTLSYGTKVAFDSQDCQQSVVVYDSNADRVVIFYYGAADGKGYAIVGTVSGTSISFGTRVEFEPGEIGDGSGVFDPVNNKVVFLYKDVGANANLGTYIIGTVSGSSVSFTTPVVWHNAITRQCAAVYDTTNNKIVVAFRDVSASSHGKMFVADPGASSLTFGSEQTFASATTYPHELVDDTVNGKLIIFYGNASQQGSARVITVDGANKTISAGSELVYEAGSTDTTGSAAYNTLAGKAQSMCKDQGDSNKAKLYLFTVSGTSITLDSTTVIDTNGCDRFAGDFSPSLGASVFVYTDEGASQGEAFVTKLGYNTLTSENYIGMSRGTAFQTGSAASAGTAVAFVSGEAIYNAAVFDSNSNKVVIAYRNSSSGDNGFAVVGTVSGSSISFGTPVAFNSGSSSTNHISMSFDSNLNKVVIAYQDGGNSSYGTAIVGTVAGTDISFGTEVVFESANTDSTAVAYDANAQKHVIFYRDNGDAHGKGIVGTVSGTSISFGSAVQFSSNTNPVRMSPVYDSNAQKIVLAWRAAGASNVGRAAVATVSGTSVSFGSTAVYDSGQVEDVTATFDSSNNKVVVVARDNNDAGKAYVGTVSGTNITFGSAVQFVDGSSSDVATNPRATFDSNLNRVVIAYKDSVNSDYGTAISGTVSGTSITFDTATVFEQANTLELAATFDSNSNKSVFAYRDVGTNYGTAVTFTPTTLATTRGEVADGGNVSMDIIGSVSDNQIGLTAGQQYFVQTDGTISTTADSPSVLAGTAISATELVVKT